MKRANSRDEQLFADALSRPAQDRAAFLEGACHGDSDLRARIFALLAAHTNGDSLIAGAPLRRPTIHEEQPGDAIGRYKLSRKSARADAVSSGWPSKRSRSAAALR